MQGEVLPEKISWENPAWLGLLPPGLTLLFKEPTGSFSTFQSFEQGCSLYNAQSFLILDGVLGFET